MVWGLGALGQHGFRGYGYEPSPAPKSGQMSDGIWGSSSLRRLFEATTQFGIRFGWPMT